MKRVRVTSAEALRAITPTLPRREQVVFDALKAWRGEPPTGYELTEALRRTHQAFDVNSVRPRLTGLQNKGIVATGERRRCRVSGKNSFTWIVVGPRPVSDPIQQALAL